jgi:ribosome biogenesis GTPase A
MAIQWFPGHMHLTRKAIEERIKDIDVVIEMLDARLPGSSANPMLAQLIQGKPGLKVLSKQDLADPERTLMWLAHYNAMPNVKAIGLDTSMVSPAKALIDACHQLAPNRGGTAKTGDEAGVTKLEQRITLADDFYLYDTPGVLWPRIIVEKSGYNLAASGAIGVNAFDDEEVALELLNYLIPNYPQALALRYKIKEVNSHTDETMLEAIARFRGAIQSGGRVNTTKAAEIVIHDFRSAALGRLTLETPLEFADWLASGLQADADRALRKEALQKEKKTARKAKPRN